jgi:hypothetical protein
MSGTKKCYICGETLPISEFYTGVIRGRSYLSGRCKCCDTRYARSRRNKNGTQIPLDQAKNIGAYLGVHIAERLLGNIFKTSTRMPYGNPGYDFICGRGFKVDVKASCRHHKNGRSTDRWSFNIKKNTVADYFACFAMDSRECLNPEHFWLIPAGVVNHKSTILMIEGSLTRWNKYEQPIERAIAGCSLLKGVPA